MEKDIEWIRGGLETLTKQIRELNHYNDELIRDNNQLRNELDNQGVLTQEWIDEHAMAVSYDGMPDQTEIVYVDELEQLINSKKEEN